MWKVQCLARFRRARRRMAGDACVALRSSKGSLLHLRTARTRGRGLNNNRSLRPNVQLANDAAEVIILTAKKSGEIGAARNARVQPVGDQLRPDLRCLCCRSEPSGEL